MFLLHSQVPSVSPLTRSLFPPRAWRPPVLGGEETRRPGLCHSVPMGTVRHFALPSSVERKATWIASPVSAVPPPSPYRKQPAPSACRRSPLAVREIEDGRGECGTLSPLENAARSSAASLIKDPLTIARLEHPGSLGLAVTHEQNAGKDTAADGRAGGRERQARAAARECERGDAFKPAWGLAPRGKRKCGLKQRRLRILRSPWVVRERDQAMSNELGGPEPGGAREVA
ncbi:hypothetical protein AAFF_G00375500 [Aldrovandia affinis]|uniref:Uncharacterized protein n=1 Tax=Aldrovandia affinis TaxID=143900 RepID=A0AAD7WMY2_9TELE|nr:hypothetical protein AAFF_G00375500 [Aldrovandia affinis]